MKMGLTHRVIQVFTRYTFILMIIPLMVIIFPLMKAGVSIGGDFPFGDVGNYAADKLWLWMEKGSYANFEVVSRFPIIWVWNTLGQVGLSPEIATKLMIIAGFALSSFSFYYSFIYLVKRVLSSSLENGSGVNSADLLKLKLGGIVGGLFYAYNVWSFHRISHWYLWIGYAILPLFLVTTFLAFKYPKNWIYIVSCILLWAAASTTPHMTVFYALIFVSTFVICLVKRILSRKYVLVFQLMIPFVSVMLLYLLLNLYWIYPYIMASQTRDVAPDYLLVMENIQTLSRDSNFINTLRLVSDWLGSTQADEQENSFIHSLWFIATLIIPLFVFSCLLLLKRNLLKYGISFLGMAIVGIILAMGTNSIFNYYEVIFSSPILVKYVWIFRDPDKWSFLISLGYSLVLGLGVYSFLLRVAKLSSRNLRVITSTSFLFILLASVCVSSYPTYKSILQNTLSPVPFPSEFDKLNTYLLGLEAEKVYFMPYPSDETVWNKQSQAGGIYQIHSAKPSIESIGSLHRNYYNYFVKSILENQTKSIGNFLYPLGTRYIVFHNDTWSKSKSEFNQKNVELLAKFSDMENTEPAGKIGFFNIFATGSKNVSIHPVNVPVRSLGAIGGLDLLGQLNTFTSFDSSNSSVVFLDNMDGENFDKFDNILIQDGASAHDLILGLGADEYMFAPSSATHDYNPMKLWSKSGTTDPLYGDYHTYLSKFAIDNWQFDYGKGIVITQSSGANISIPFEIKESDIINQAFVRYLENQKGGMLRFYVDGHFLEQINTLGSSNKFVWRKIFDTESATVDTSKRDHVLTIENVNGVNAVNVLSLIPSGEVLKYQRLAEQILRDSRNIIVLEAEKSFLNLLNGNMQQISTTKDSYSGEFEVPSGAAWASIVVSGTNPPPNNNNSVAPESLDIMPAKRKQQLLLIDFEMRNSSTTLASLRQPNLISHNSEILRTYLEQANPISGNVSLGVTFADEEPTNKWAMVTTDLIPIDENSYYNFSLDLSAKSVSQLHAKIVYYDAEKKRLNQDFIFDGKDGTFQRSFSASLVPHIGAKYLRAEILVDPLSASSASYTLDNIRLDEIGISKTLKLYSGALEENKESALTNQILQSEPFAVRQKMIYNYTINQENHENNREALGETYLLTSAGNNNSFTVAYPGASNGEIRNFAAGTTVYSDVDIQKPSNYTIAARMKYCGECSPIVLSVLNKTGLGNPVYETRASMHENTNASKSYMDWVFIHNVPLSEGEYQIRVKSESPIELDLVALYNSEPHKFERDGRQNPAPHNIFDYEELIPYAKLSGYEKINPTKYTATIANATGPYVLSLAETYDPLWTAYVNGDANNSQIQAFPLYSIINGFRINETGNYTLTIEYQPQAWFGNSKWVSIIVLISLLIVISACIILKKTKRISP